LNFSNAASNPSSRPFLPLSSLAQDAFDSEFYSGVPIYRQVSCATQKESKKDDSKAKGGFGVIVGTACDPPHFLAQRQIGTQKYWIISDQEGLMAHEGNGGDYFAHNMVGKDKDAERSASQVEGISIWETIKYSTWNSDVTPPRGGWRVRGRAEGEDQGAPVVLPVVSSLYELEELAHPMTHEKRLRAGGVFPKGKTADKKGEDKDSLSAEVLDFEAKNPGISFLVGFGLVGLLGAYLYNTRNKQKGRMF
jgi:hypothetical protein